VCDDDADVLAFVGAILRESGFTVWEPLARARHIRLRASARPPACRFVVTNVAAFGAFVDVGVHQDGLVHISAIANAYVKDPRQVVKPGDIIRVKVLEVEPKRRRISLTMRLDDAPEARATRARAEIATTAFERPLRHAQTRSGRSDAVPATGDAMAEAFRRAGVTARLRGGNKQLALQQNWTPDRPVRHWRSRYPATAERKGRDG